MLESRAFEGSRGPPQQINTKVFYKNFLLNNISSVLKLLSLLTF
jgi:hypothetical protein